MAAARNAAALATLVFSSISITACASILGYDSLSAREDARDATPTLDAPHADQSTLDAPPADGLDAEASPPLEAPVRPPDRPTGAAVASGKGKTLWLIVKHFFLGAHTSSGVTTKDAWRGWGYDLDHVCTSPKQSEENVGTCKRVVDANPDILTDGDGCRDNNFGSQLIPLVQFYYRSFEDDANAGIERGNNTWILSIEDLDDGVDDPYAPGKLYKAGSWSDYGRSTPKFDGTDVREVEDISVNGDLAHPKTTFPLGYVRGNTWVSGDGEAFVASVPLSSVNTDLDLVGTRLTLKLADDHTTGGLGVLAGALPEAKVDALLIPIASAGGFCPGSSIYQALRKSVTQSFDLVGDAPNLQSTSVTCDALSMGIGFVVAPIMPVTTVVGTPPPVTTACDDAGVGGG